MLHNLTRLASLSLSLAAALFAGGCDDQDVQPRDQDLQVLDHVADFAAEADQDDDTPRSIGEILISCDVAVDGPGCDGATDTLENSLCYCGYKPGYGVIYVKADCRGYSSTQTCCASACSAGEGGVGNG